MNCLEFRQIALSDPNHKGTEFIKHSQQCPDCMAYLKSVKQMDVDLAQSLEVGMPPELTARLKLAHELTEQTRINTSRRYALVASVAVALFIGGFFASNQWNMQQTIATDYQHLVSAVMEHANEKTTPVWSSEHANRSVQALLASYDSTIKLKTIDNLRFGRICPMGRYRGLHATMQTDEGQVTFAYIKGEPLGELLDTTYQGYMARVKPVKNGNIIIMSRTDRALNQVDKELTDAMYWDI